MTAGSQHLEGRCSNFDASTGPTSWAPNVTTGRQENRQDKHSTFNHQSRSVTEIQASIAAARISLTLHGTQGAVVLDM
eukprot:2674660-Rhodomonas_salina.2